MSEKSIDIIQEAEKGHSPEDIAVQSKQERKEAEVSQVITMMLSIMATCFEIIIRFRASRKGEARVSQVITLSSIMATCF